uniref:Uncharacterized protein n=1 Tax=Kalanchoe fedtschenkoi TaxID=63787 RepID=A0A7N0UYV7_KALFE
MLFMPWMLRSLVRLVNLFVYWPTQSVTTLLYYSDLLPRDVNLERQVRADFLDSENHLFHFLINVLRCF